MNEVEISICERNIFCSDCDNTDCWHCGDYGADCPFYRCKYIDDEVEVECEKCPELKKYKKQYQKKRKEEEEK